MSNVDIRLATEGDLKDILDLLGEIDKYYGDEMTESPEERERQTREILSGSEFKSARILIAFNMSNDAIGFASFSALWPAAGSSSSLYLKELYVRENHRTLGAGKALVQHLLKIATEQGYSRVEWTTDRSNGGAQKFYDKLGATVNTGKLFYRVEV
ncbi:GNAT family N-acetyltransferase [Actinokineospora diospyrosa]|uniref:Acetyltransferase (GNAT) family protein n=1 Tax=Actinokineospora diospyrosa TaxID=103728 RepID=A0ABT1IFH5_9PSEU|nr:GNAT family N-acetyltransferase [Actinokineospora diospyrosa]MCP2271406.1 Acetyltransferase (GNAT) family protein [Actinokineospora diospyrosa]